MLMNIQEVIVVEGKNDREKIQSCVHADVIITRGLHLSHQTLRLLKKIHQERGLIIFTDPDTPGKQIRQRIEDYVGPCKHAHILSKDGRDGSKVGIEHASCEVIVAALKKAQVYPRKKAVSKTLLYSEFIDLGLTGDKHSQRRRNLLADSLGFPECNAKTCYKYLNILEVNKEQCEKILGEG